MKNKGLTIVLLMCMVILSGCSNKKTSPKENEILKDFKECYGSEFIYEKIETVYIEKQQTNEADKTFFADIILEGEDEYASYTMAGRVEYSYYDDQGWLLEEWIPSVYEDISYVGTLNRGLSDEELYELIAQKSIYISPGEADYTVISSTIEEFSQIFQGSMRIDTPLLSCEGDLELQCDYDGHEWNQYLPVTPDIGRGMNNEIIRNIEMSNITSVSSMENLVGYYIKDPEKASPHYVDIQYVDDETIHVETGYVPDETGYAIRAENTGTFDAVLTEVGSEPEYPEYLFLTFTGYRSDGQECTVGFSYNVDTDKITVDTPNMTDKRILGGTSIGPDRDHEKQ